MFSYLKLGYYTYVIVKAPIFSSSAVATDMYVMFLKICHVNRPLLIVLLFKKLFISD